MLGPIDRSDDYSRSASPTAASAGERIDDPRAARTSAGAQTPADGPRIGILSKAGFLSQFANQKEGSPTLRGKFMRMTRRLGATANTLFERLERIEHEADLHWLDAMSAAPSDSSARGDRR